MKILIFGCGQGGQAVKNWLPADSTLIAFVDNDPSKWGTQIENIPVIAPAQILTYAPDLIWIAVLNREAALSIERQLTDMGYIGKIQSIIPLHDHMDIRLAHLRLLAREINERHLPGAVAELGVYQGVFAAEINRLFPDRPIYLFDTFQGFSDKDLETEKKQTACTPSFKKDFKDTSIEKVLAHLPYPEQAIICPGYFPETLPPDLPDLAFVSLDPDLYEPVYQGLCAFWPRLIPGGIILIHDYNSTQFTGAGKAVRTFCRENHLMVIPLVDLHGRAILMKQS